LSLFWPNGTSRSHTPRRRAILAGSPGRGGRGYLLLIAFAAMKEARPLVGSSGRADLAIGLVKGADAVSNYKPPKASSEQGSGYAATEPSGFPTPPA
jgi:hypothetical protein